ncbi:LAFA_0B08262g1_1 [Lachancea sp. 'fantastica']|nr:LAFA_0B08262g1_1 [Lachancea sp. 'fantastica']
MSQSNNSSSSTNEEVVVEVSKRENEGLDVMKSEARSVVSSQSGEHSSAEKGYKTVTSRDADVTLQFLRENDHLVEPITPEEERKLSRKTMWIVVGLTALINLLLYADKAVMSFAAIFTFFEDTGLTQNKYNNANTLFYVGYIVGQGNLYFIQKLPLSRVMVVMTSLWTVIIFLHCTAHNYQGVYVLRFFLGFVESIAIPALNTTMGQFLTPREKSATAPVFYAACMGVTIPVGFIAYGVLNINDPPIAAWKIFTIIIGGCTFLLTVLIFFVYPSNPTDAVFLSKKERIWTIRRVQESTGSSIEQKTFKPYQVKEALKDPISWIFGAFFLLQQLANNLTYQQNLLFENLGQISNLDSTLVSVASGGFAVVCAIIATTFLLYKKNFVAFSVVAWSSISFVGSIGAATLPWHNSVGLLAFVCLASPVFGIPWILMFSWNAQTCSGYTKKLTRNGIVMFWFGVSNLISPQLWQEKDAPRYIPAWIVQIVLSFCLAPSLALLIWFILRRRNKQRLAKIGTTKNKAAVVEDDGERVETNVALLDLTDLENEEFIYPL